MSKNIIKIDKIQKHWNASGERILKYSVEMYNKDSKEYKLLAAPKKHLLENKVELQKEKWMSIHDAKQRTEAANSILEGIDNLLLYSLHLRSAVNWKALKKEDKFSRIKPSKVLRYENRQRQRQ